MLKPQDIATELGISSATLRLWSKHFAAYLSPSAQSTLTEQGTPAQRRYSAEDRALFVRAKSLLDLGLTYQEVISTLAEPVVTPPLPLALLIREDPLPPATAPQNGHQDYGELIALMQRSLAVQEQILSTLQNREPAAVAGNGYAASTLWERIKTTLR
jgi:DNA-binding transcriptional MerR regulator